MRKKLQRPRPSPVQTINKLIQERYSDAKAVFLAGSVPQQQETTTSDLDIVIIFDHLPNAYREAFLYESWPIDAFIHDPETLIYFFERIDIPSFSPTLPYMVAHGLQVPQETPLGNKLQQKALQLLNTSSKGDQSTLTTRRFLITDLIDDLRVVRNDHEKMAIIFRLYEKLAEFYLLVHNQWIGSGKQLARKLTDFNPEIAQQFFSVFQHPHDTQKIIAFAENILKPHGGLLWDGFKSEVPKAYKLLEREDLNTLIQQLELSLLDSPTRKSVDYLNKRIADEFVEFGASGNIYNKQDVLASLPLEKERKFTVEDFSVKALSPDVVLATYKIIGDDVPVASLRSSIWKRVDGEWCMVFHQGTKQL